MSRRSWVLWGTALAWAAGPGLYDWLWSETGDELYFSAVSGGSCPGHSIYLFIEQPVWAVLDFPLFWYGGAPLILLAFAAWHIGIRIRRARAGRIAARSAAATLLSFCLPQLVLLTVDAALDPGCLDPWGPPDMLTWTVGMGLYSLVPPLLILHAVRDPRRLPVRRSRPARALAAVVAATAVLLLPSQATPPGKVSTERELDCGRFGDGTVTGLGEAEKSFLCQVRRHASDDPAVERWKGVPDRIVLAQGRHLCDLATRHGGDVNAPAVRDAPHASLTSALPRLCPPVARAQEAEAQRQREEEERYVAEMERACAARPRHRPRIKPVRQASATMWTEFWTIDAREDGYGATAPTLIEELVGTAPGVLSVWAADEVGFACVTGESYARRPPLQTKGWHEVVDVAYESPTGSLVITDMSGKSLPDLTSGGPGAYRVRVHLRGRELVYQQPDPPDGAVELLIMVYPGKGKDTVVYR
ncbi:hypothetical protein [Thermoactinospora rubra]|uniref:hypothetical protein n=1 Tax=Thermoactinospora rubra TaxID=1088767 RepID=UPI00117BF80C|nr:hypothetical protein [Thermoactinospora rubra]